MNGLFSLLLLLLLLCAVALPSRAANEDIGTKCKHAANKNAFFQPEVYYINMDRSTARRKATEEQVGRVLLRDVPMRDGMC
jgi:hypothetical protein